MRVVAIAFSLAAVLLAASAGAQSAGQPAGATASAWGIRIVSAAGNGGTETVTGPPEQLFIGGAFAYPSDGSVVSASSRSVFAGGDTKDVATANASATVTGISIFNGEITVSSVTAKAHATATASDATGDGDGSAVSGVAINAPDFSSWGTISQVVKGGGPTGGALPGYHGYVIGLDLHLTADHGGLPAGSEIQIGYADVTVQAAKPAPIPTPPVQTTPKPAPHPANKAPAPSPGGAPFPVRKIPSITPRPTAGGYVFPVYGQVSWTDTFGAFRGDVSGGWHHGDDIFAPYGAPILAVADGTVFSVGYQRVGGNRLWLMDKQGNQFYYAHLSAFSPLAKNGARVQAGDVLGFVGNSGDAQGTPFHLHFEYHPVGWLYLGYDGAANPSPLLAAWQHLQDIRFDAAAAWAPTQVSSANAPKPGAILLQAEDISSASGLDPRSLNRALASMAREGDGTLELRAGATPAPAERTGADR